MFLETSVTYSFTQLANNFRYKFDLKMNELNLHGGQVFVLTCLWNLDGQSQIDLAAYLKLSAPTVNKMVKSLVGSGFVESRQCKNDGRIMRVYLTPRGIEHQKLVEEKFAEFEIDFFSSLTETERLILTQIFEKLKGNLLSRKSSEQIS